MMIQGIELVIMLMVDYGYVVQFQIYIVIEDSIVNCCDVLVVLMVGELCGWDDCCVDFDVVVQMMVQMFFDVGLDLDMQ